MVKVNLSMRTRKEKKEKRKERSGTSTGGGQWLEQLLAYLKYLLNQYELNKWVNSISVWSLGRGVERTASEIESRAVSRVVKLKKRAYAET